MINIISKSIYNKEIRGPKKVVDNLIKGLDIMGYPYVINHRLDSCNKLWIHDDLLALKKVNLLPDRVKVIIGPNLYVYPSEIPKSIDLSNTIFSFPTSIVKNIWIEQGYDRSKTDVCPSGIDTDTYKPSIETKKTVMLYFKNRNEEELSLVKSELEFKKINYELISYGFYTETDYINKLAHSKYIIWLGGYESQGIALEEALSANVPILVIDKEKEEHTLNRDNTAAPYFDQSCGIKISGLANLKTAIKNMEKNYAVFNPRKYIMENLSLAKQARDFIFLFEKHFGLKVKDGYFEKILVKGKWFNSYTLMIIYYRIKELIKNLIKKWTR